jgi:hypothetical protein
MGWYAVHVVQVVEPPKEGLAPPVGTPLRLAQPPTQDPTMVCAWHVSPAPPTRSPPLSYVYRLQGEGGKGVLPRAHLRLGGDVAVVGGGAPPAPAGGGGGAPARPESTVPE